MSGLCVWLYRCMAVWVKQNISLPLPCHGHDHPHLSEVQKKIIFLRKINIFFTFSGAGGSSSLSVEVFLLFNCINLFYIGQKEVHYLSNCSASA